MRVEVMRVYGRGKPDRPTSLLTICLQHKKKETTMRPIEGFIENQLGFKVIPDHEAAYAPVREKAPSTIYIMEWSPEMSEALWEIILDEINNINDIE